MKNVGAVLLAFISASIVVMAIESLQFTDMESPGKDASWEDIEEYIQNLPLISFIKVIAAHALGALVGGLVAKWVSGSDSNVAAWIFGGLFLGVTIINLFAIPHPLWFSIVDIIVILPFTFLGLSIANRYLKKEKIDYE